MARSLRAYPQNFLLLAFFDGIKSAFSPKKDWQPKSGFESYEKYRQTAYRLKRRGLITIKRDPAGQRFMELTKAGSMELLMAKAWLKPPKDWDGKWRLVIFDIPEDATAKRNQLRKLLLKNGFSKLQQSVYLHPYPLNRLAVDYLKATGLIDYIRFGRLEELDDDAEFIKKYHLRQPS